MAVDLNTSVPHSARIYDHLLGGKDNFEADRSAAAEIVKASPSIPISMRANRRYMARVARYLAHERGIRQFLDIGAGLPTAPNLHEVVQSVDPATRIVYVDNDPIVLRQARPLLASTAQGSITYLEADLRQTGEILNSPEVRDGIDPSRPVAISLIAVLQFVPDESEAHKIIDALLDPFPSGSALAISTVTAHNEQAVAGAAAYRSRGIPAVARTDDEVTALFRGLELVEPGATLVSRWRPGPEDAEVEDFHVQMSGGVAIKR
jgi:O-methyltransferase involved in polyketide biosynthesis